MNEFCAYADGQCGASTQERQCETVPLDCIYEPGTWEPVCGCDGEVYPINCDAAGRRVDTGPPENCTSFPCGDASCDIDTEYCQRQVSDVGGEPDTYACQPLPAGCGAAPDCTCLQGEACGDLCAGQGPLGLQLTCPGG